MVRLAPVFMAALLLSGCAGTVMKPADVQLSFVNDSGRPVTIQLLGATAVTPTGSAIKTIRPFVSRRYLVLRVLSEECTYTYDVPMEHLPAPGAGGEPLTLQIEKDNRLFASRSLTSIAVGDLIASQPTGFPLSLAATDCQAA